MRNLKTISLFAAICVALALTGCSSTRPTPYTGLASSSQLRPNQNENADRVPYQYSSNVAWRNYSNVLFEPVEIYRGTDGQFEDISAEEKEALAQYMQTQFEKTLTNRFALANASFPQTIRVKMTLTGAKLNTRFVSTILRFDLAGGPYNAVQAARDKEGLMTGSVSYAIEIFDASTDRLLMAYVAKQFPNAWNISATLGRLDAAKVGIDKAAEDLSIRLK